jgi:hypothetical protein
MRAAGESVTVTTTIGGMGPTLYIVDGGTRLPGQPVSGN